MKFVDTVMLIASGFIILYAVNWLRVFYQDEIRPKIMVKVEMVHVIYETKCLRCDNIQAHDEREKYWVFNERFKHGADPLHCSKCNKNTYSMIVALDKHEPYEIELTWEESLNHNEN